MPGVWSTGVTWFSVTLLVVIFLAVSNAASVSKRICPSRSVGCSGVCGANMVCVKNCLRMCAITKRSGDDTESAAINNFSGAQQELWMPKQSIEPSSSNQCVLDAVIENLSPEWKLNILSMFQLAIESTLNEDNLSEANPAQW